MYLYNLTLQRASGITHAVHGNFSGTRTQELVVSRGRSLELLRPDPNTGKVRFVPYFFIHYIDTNNWGLKVPGSY